MWGKCGAEWGFGAGVLGGAELSADGFGGLDEFCGGGGGVAVGVAAGVVFVVEYAAAGIGWSFYGA